MQKPSIYLSVHMASSVELLVSWRTGNEGGRGSHPSGVLDVGLLCATIFSIRTVSTTAWLSIQHETIFLPRRKPISFYLTYFGAFFMLPQMLLPHTRLGIGETSLNWIPCH